MNNLKIFNNKEFGEIRTVTIDNEPWFVGKDVAQALGYSNSSKAMADHVDKEDKLNNESLSSLGQRGGWLINESGLYSLILSSKLPGAKRFKRWVTAEVLPSIRKTGGYQMKVPEGKELLALAVLEAQKTIEEQEAQIERMKPKEIFADAVATSHTSILVGELAKILRQNGVNVGQNRLFAVLREEGYLVKRKGTDYNMPTQKSMDLGLFEIKEGSYTDANGCNKITKTTKVTGKGQQYFINRFLAKRNNAQMSL